MGGWCKMHMKKRMLEMEAAAYASESHMAEMEPSQQQPHQQQPQQHVSNSNSSSAHMSQQMNHMTHDQTTLLSHGLSNNIPHVHLQQQQVLQVLPPPPPSPLPMHIPQPSTAQGYGSALAMNHQQHSYSDIMTEREQANKRPKSSVEI
jgi:hypothetical protein